MVLLTARNIKKSYTEKPLLIDINLNIREGEKIGLVGVNGSGKSTLLKIIAGAMDEEGGEIVRSNDLRVGYLPQNPDYDPELSVIDQALAYTDNTVPEYVLRSMLSRMHTDMYDQKMGTLSGGQRKRVALAAVMAKDTNLLILDEPTNHMDNDIIEWMEEKLINYKGAVFMITHDRYFLERVVDTICEIEKGKLVTYEGNYDKYLVAKAERLQMAMATERKRAAIYKKELRWIRWSAPARTTKAKGRIQRFEELEKGKETFEDPHLDIGTVSSRLGKTIIELENISYSVPLKPEKADMPETENFTEYYDNADVSNSSDIENGRRTLIRDFTYTVLRNDRIGIVGPNGCGKTTLMRLIMGQLQPESGDVRIGETVKIGYFSQESEDLPMDMRVIKYIEGISNNIKTSEGYLSASQMLERFLFPAYMHSTVIGRLSGGERRRLYLLSILMQAPNVLIFDEPTNDLDIDTLTVLEDYLDDFPGAVVIVSHDRYFLDRLVVRTFAFEGNGLIGHYTGGYSKYMNEKEEREALAGTSWGSSSVGSSGKAAASGAGLASSDAGASSSQTGNGLSPSSSAKSDGRNQKPAKLKFSYKEQREWDTIEDDIAKLEEQIAETETEMSKIAADYVKLTELTNKKEALEEELLEKMDRWEYLSELAEKIARGETE